MAALFYNSIWLTKNYRCGIWIETHTAIKDGISSSVKRAICLLENGGKEWLSNNTRMPHNVSSIDIVFTVGLQPQNKEDVVLMSNTAYREIEMNVYRLFGLQVCTISTEFVNGGNIRWRLLISFEHHWAVNSLRYIDPHNKFSTPL